jgi:hypothetical protein
LRRQEAARDVQLDLPETGVCSTDLLDAQENTATGGGCCGSSASTVEPAAGRGLATGVSGGLLTAPAGPAARSPDPPVLRTAPPVEDVQRLAAELWPDDTASRHRVTPS